MRGFKEHEAADRFCREYDELGNFLRSRSRHNQYVPATRRRRHFLPHARIAIGIKSGVGAWDPTDTCRLRQSQAFGLYVVIFDPWMEMPPIKPFWSKGKATTSLASVVLFTVAATPRSTTTTFGSVPRAHPSLRSR
jgi:hypothetical protein